MDRVAVLIDGGYFARILDTDFGRPKERIIILACLTKVVHQPMRKNEDFPRWTNLSTHYEDSLGSR